MVWHLRNADGSLKNIALFIIIFGTLSFPIHTFMWCLVMGGSEASQSHRLRPPSHVTLLATRASTHIETPLGSKESPITKHNRHSYVIVRPLSTVEYTSVASLFHCRQWSDWLNSWPWIGLVCRRGLFTLGWMCALKREQARCEWESELQHVNSLQTLL